MVPIIKIHFQRIRVLSSLGSSFVKIPGFQCSAQPPAKKQPG
jgi:hypothetical protein